MFLVPSGHDAKAGGFILLPMNRWDNPTYRQIVAAHTEQGVLFVRFANGEEATVLLRNISPTIDSSKAHALTNQHIRINSFEVKISYEGQTIVVPWDVLRFQTDTGYARYMLETADQQAIEIGSIIRTMRGMKGMTIEDVSLRTDFSLSKLKSIEVGDRDVAFRDLCKILGAMGFGMKDIAEMYHHEKR